MWTHLIKYCLVVAAGCIVQFVSGQKQNVKSHTLLKSDTSLCAIISFNKNWNYPFDSTYKKAVFAKKDLQLVDSLLVVGIQNYDDSLEPKYKNFSIDLARYKYNKYRKQLVAVINRSGEKEVWVNCFCRTYDTRWKKEILFFEDGGNCYYSFKINLSTKTFYDLGVNGYAYYLKSPQNLVNR